MKKIISTLLALVMAFSLTTVAFAANKNDDGTFKDESTITITKEYKLTNAGTTSPAETFNFTKLTCTKVEDAGVDVTVANAPVPTIGSVEYEAGEAGSETAKKEITITLPKYKAVGKYTYTFSEVDNKTAGVTYHSDDITLVVTVIEQDGKVRVAAVHTETAQSDEKSNKIENVYSAGSLSVTKTVTGNLGDKEKYFAITIKLTGEPDKDYSGNKISIGGEISSIDNPDSVEVGTPATFYLKHGEYVTLGNIPCGVSYTVTEADLTDYTETIEDNDTGKIEAASQSVSVKNEKNGEVDTGINMDSLPYILLLAVACVGMLVFFTKKRSMREN